MEIENRESVDEVTFLDETAQKFVATIGQRLADGDEIYEVLDHVAEFLGAEALSVFEVDASTGDLVLKYATGEVGPKIVGLRLESGQGVVGWVTKYSEDLIVPYPGLDARFFEGVDESTGFSTSSILCCPIQIDDQTVGAIEVLNKTKGTFDDEDRILLRAIARLLVEVVPTIG